MTIESGRFEAVTFADPDTARLLDRAIETIVRLRGRDITDAGARLSALISLIGQAERQLPNAVAYANEHHSWAWIAQTLGITQSTARRRYTQPPRRPTDTQH